MRSGTIIIRRAAVVLAACLLAGCADDDEEATPMHVPPVTKVMLDLAPARVANQSLATDAAPAPAGHVAGNQTR